MNVILLIILFLVLAGLAVFLGWIAVTAGIKLFDATKDDVGSTKHWIRFAAVVTGIVFMSSAISTLGSGIQLVASNDRKSSSQSYYY